MIDYISMTAEDRVKANVKRALEAIGDSDLEPSPAKNEALNKLVGETFLSTWAGSPEESNHELKELRNEALNSGSSQYEVNDAMSNARQRALLFKGAKDE